MREVRADPMTGRRVLLCDERLPALRPRRADSATGDCAFCPDQEQDTRPTIAAIDGEHGWVARAFANRLPAVVLEAELQTRFRGPEEGRDAFGAHEVIVESRRHAPWLSGADTQAALQLARMRLGDLLRDERFEWVGWYRNRGTAAGASMVHPHAQVVALPFVPAEMEEGARRQRDWFAATHTPMLEAVIDSARHDGRLLFEEGGVVALCPWAPEGAFDVWLVPSAASARFEGSSDALLGATADAMSRVITAYRRILDGPPYNAWLVQGGRRTEAGERWHLRLRPAILNTGGFERGGFGAMHPVFPEEAARWLTTAL